MPGCVLEHKAQGVQLKGVANKNTLLNDACGHDGVYYFNRFVVLTSHLDAYTSRSNDFCADKQ